jgi:hypothetical protein
MIADTWKEPHKPPNRRMGGPQSQSGYLGEERKFFNPAMILILDFLVYS